MTRILLVEDTFALRVAIASSLRSAGYEVVAVGSAEEAGEELWRQSPSLVVLDWMLPGVQGIDLLKTWRDAGNRVPVILLTARDAVADRVTGLTGGANDYLVKPFAPEELLARIAVQLRDRVVAGSTLRLQGFEVDLQREVVRSTTDRRGGAAAEVGLTTQEARTLGYLSARPGKPVHRDELLKEVWGYRGGVQTRSVDNTILRLRAKIEQDPTRPRHVLTVQGVGYRFEP